jgi:Reductase C-terminal
VPYFFTDQYDLGMEYAGYVEPDGYDEVVFRGDAGRREFIAFWLGGGRVLTDMNVNVWDVNEAIRRSCDPASRWTPAPSATRRLRWSRSSAANVPGPGTESDTDLMLAGCSVQRRPASAGQ